MIPQLGFFQYNPIYQGAPIEETEKAYQLSANQFDVNLDKYNKLQTFAASVKALPNDKTYLDQKMATTGEALKSLSTGIQGTKRWDLANDVIQKMTTEYTQDPKLNAIRESYLNFQEGEKLKQAMRAKGDTPFEITDIRNHKSFDDEGNINIYQPVIQPKADYVKEANDIFANIAPDVIAADLQPSEVEGILQGRTVKGFTREKLLSKMNDVESVYKNTDSGQQHKLFIQKNSPEENPDAFIKDFLFSVGSLRTFTEERRDRMVDPSYEWRQRGLLEREKMEARMRLQAMKGSSKFDPDSEGLLRREALRSIDSGIVDPKTKLTKKIKSNALMISNSEIIKDYSDSQYVGDGNRIVPLDKTKKFNFEKDQIVSTKIKGFALDDENGEGTLGGQIAEIEYLDEDDNKKTMNVVIKPADQSFKGLFETQSGVNNILRKHNQGKVGGSEGNLKGDSVLDTSGLLGDPGNFAFYVDKNNVVRPQVKKTDGSWRLLQQNELMSLGLKEFYSTEDLENLTANQVAQTLKPYVKTNKDIQASN